MCPVAIVINMSDEYRRIIRGQRVIYLTLSVFNPVAKWHRVRRDRGIVDWTGDGFPGMRRIQWRVNGLIPNLQDARRSVCFAKHLVPEFNSRVYDPYDDASSGIPCKIIDRPVPNFVGFNIGDTVIKVSMGRPLLFDKFSLRMIGQSL